jgi:hypothetical protein
VRLRDLPALAEEFFSSEYRRHRWGFPREWSGSDMGRLSIGPVADRETFINLFGFLSPSGDLAPNREWIRSNPVVAQRLTYSGSPSDSTIFTLGAFKEQVTILKARREAVRQMMDQLQRFSELKAASTLPELGRGCLFATFHTAAASDQTPRLESHILIAQQYRLPNGDEVRFPLEVSQGAVGALIARAEWRRQSELVGTFGLTSRSQVPSGLFTPPTWKDLEPTVVPERDRGRNRKLVYPQIDNAWKRQAKARGFGPEQVEALFSAGRQMGNFIGWERFRHRMEEIQDMRHSPARTESSSPERKRDIDHSHSF